MAGFARTLIRISLLLLPAGGVLAQSWPPSPEPAPLREFEAVQSWPQPPTLGTQTSFRILRNDAAETVLGVSLQQSRFPSFVLQLEVVPPLPHADDATSALTQAPSPARPDAPAVRAPHKLSLRYRF